jgi:hypothetical protein
MTLLDTTSLGGTIDAVNEAFFEGLALPKAECAAAAAWIAARQGERGTYRDMPAPTAEDFRHFPRLFAGERLNSRASTSHILGQEACRALILLGVHTQPIDAAIRRAQAWLREPQDRRDPRYGTYCCGICSIGLWRHLAVSDVSGARDRIKAGLKILRQRRDGQGRWRIFPFHYTLLALLELDSRMARQEMRYAAPVCERLARRGPPEDPYARRRQVIARRVLEQCQ